MNEACAAGTGSFLEERAEELGVCIKGEFAERALSSPAPVRLGERCTVFMERDVTAYQQQGAETDDLLAGLALSVVTGMTRDGTFLIEDGKIDTKPWITHRMPLAAVPQEFPALYDKPDLVKALIEVEPDE